MSRASIECHCYDTTHVDGTSFGRGLQHTHTKVTLRHRAPLAKLVSCGTLHQRFPV